jgi:hypothetical protein
VKAGAGSVLPAAMAGVGAGSRRLARAPVAQAAS